MSEAGAMAPASDRGAIGRVLAVARRPAPGRSLLPEDCIELDAGLGIRGDLHADAVSPRQLLLASSAAYEDLALAPRALRENLLIDIETACLASGTVLQLGATVRLRMMFQCEACGQLDTAQPRLAQRIGTRRGMLARVLAGGPIRPGDPVRDLGLLAPAWSDDWRERVRRVLGAVPDGCVIEYRHLARLAGIQSSYCRAFPRVIAQFGAAYAGKAVRSQSTVALARWRGETLFERL